MLVAYLDPLTYRQQQLLAQWSVRYAHREDSSIWILFTDDLQALEWLLAWPEHSHIVRSLFD